MKKVLRTLSIAAIMAASGASLASCGVTAAVYEAGTPVKIGLICIHNEQSTYDANFINGLNEAVANLGDRVAGGAALIKTDVLETKAAFDAAKDLVKQGCNFIFADSFGHEEFIMEAAEKWPSVTFCHATGTHAGTAGLENFHNGFASIYEGRYLAGVAAGVKLQEDIASGKIAESKKVDGNWKLGYVGAFPYAEVISGYTSWYLGVKSIVDNVVMDVKFTDSWYDVSREAAAAQALIDGGAVLISQHADSMGAPGTCEDKGVLNVSYNISTEKDCPTTYVAHSRINWAPYYEAVVNAMYEGKSFDERQNYTGTMSTGSVVYDLSSNASDAAKQAVATAKNALVDGSLKVFDCSKFTVDGEHLTTYLGDTDGDFAPDTEAIFTEGDVTYFNESYYCSAPYFNVLIDGITQLL